jgi:hypothetical protein
VPSPITPIGSPLASSEPLDSEAVDSDPPASEPVASDDPPDDELDPPPPHADNTKAANKPTINTFATDETRTLFLLAAPFPNWACGRACHHRIRPAADPRRAVVAFPS